MALQLKKKETVASTLNNFKSSSDKAPDKFTTEKLNSIRSTITALTNLCVSIDTDEMRESMAILADGQPLDMRVLYNKSNQIGMYIDRDGMFILSATPQGVIRPHVKHRAFLFEEFVAELPFWSGDIITEKIQEMIIESINSTIISMMKDKTKQLKGTVNA